MEHPEADFDALALTSYIWEACFFLAALLYSVQFRSFVSCLFAGLVTCSFLIVSSAASNKP